MKRKKRTYNTRLIKRDYAYTLEELLDLLGVHKNSIYEWHKTGLPFIDDGRPSLIHGTDLMDFLKKRQARRKKTCKSNELFCFKCQMPTKPWENAVDLKILNQKQLNIMGVCEICNTKIYKVGSVKRIDEYRKIFNILGLLDSHIIEGPSTSMNCDLKKEVE
jgi:hypothetical protein